MKKAANKAYISNRKLEQYQQERERQLQLLQKPQQLDVIHEAAAEESHLPSMPSMLSADKDGDVKMVAQTEERKESAHAGKKASVMAQADESDEDNLSAEDLDSDDLEDEIQDNVEDLIMQQHQQYSMQMPPALAQQQAMPPFQQ